MFILLNKAITNFVTKLCP